MEEYEGIISKVIFYNPENKYMLFIRKTRFSTQKTAPNNNKLKF